MLKPLILTLAIALPLPSLADVLVPQAVTRGTNTMITPVSGEGVPFAGHWQLGTLLQNGAPARLDPAALAQVSLQIDAQGHGSGSNGCNRIMFQLEPRGGRGWGTDGVSSTRMLCHGDAAEVERLVMAALNDSARYVLTGGGAVLQVYDADGILRLILNRAG